MSGTDTPIKPAVFKREEVVRETERSERLMMPREGRHGTGQVSLQREYKSVGQRSGKVFSSTLMKIGSLWAGLNKRWGRTRAER